MNPERFTLAASTGGEVFIWCEDCQDCEPVTTLAEAVRWAENHALRS